MISIIICSRRPDINCELRSNIEATIGYSYELIVIDNSSATHSIASAYNLGISRSKSSILCFFHDDILFHASNWGIKLTEALEAQDSGFIGVAGSHYQPKIPCGWGHTGIDSTNIIQTHSPTHTQQIQNFYVASESPLIECVCLDGVFLGCKRELFSTITFDEQAFRGFNGYDLDICLQSRNAGYHNYLSKEILIEHFSMGNFNSTWLQDTLVLYTKWKPQLPQSVSFVTSDKIFVGDFLAMINMFIISFRSKRVFSTLPDLIFHFMNVSTIKNICKPKQLRILIWHIKHILSSTLHAKQSNATTR